MQIATERVTDVYQVEEITDGLCLLGYRLTKQDGSGKVRDIDTTGQTWACDCEDATYQPERPLGCKHIRALKRALEILETTAPAAK